MNHTTTRALTLLLLSTALIFLVGACASVSETRIFYTPTGKAFRPPKDKKAVIPILFAEPDLAYQKLGTLKFASTQPWSYFEKALRFNAREQGADAAIIRKRTIDRNVSYYRVPPSVDYQPIWRTVYYRDRKGHLRVTDVVDYFPIFRPGYIGQNVVTSISMDADLIFFKDKKN
ncbi:MAG: hypothetical protein ACK5LK_06970 [Chthoniobacterales bacterium]